METINLFNEFLVWAQTYIYGGLTASQFNDSIIKALGFNDFLPPGYADFINFITSSFYWLFPTICLLFVILAFLTILWLIGRVIVRFLPF